MRRTARVKKEKKREGGPNKYKHKAAGSQLSCLLLPKTPATIRERHVACYVYICVCVFEWLTGPVVVVAKHNTVRSLLLH